MGCPMAVKSLLEAAKAAPLSKKCAAAGCVIAAAAVTGFVVMKSREAVHNTRMAIMQDEINNTILNKGQDHE